MWTASLYTLHTNFIGRSCGATEVWLFRLCQVLDVVMRWIASNHPACVAVGRSVYFPAHSSRMSGGLDAWSGYTQVWFKGLPFDAGADWHPDASLGLRDGRIAELQSLVHACGADGGVCCCEGPHTWHM